MNANEMALDFEQSNCDGPETEEWVDAEGNECATDVCTQGPELFYGPQRCCECPRLMPA